MKGLRPATHVRLVNVRLTEQNVFDVGEIPLSAGNQLEQHEVLGADEQAPRPATSCDCRRSMIARW
jgi:hypothetical protein